MSAENPTPSGESDLRAALAAQKKKRRTAVIAVGAVAVVGLVAGTVAIVANLGSTEPTANAAEASPAPEDLSVTIATAEDSVFQDTIAEVAAEKGLEVDWLNVDDWVLPNTELVAGTVDANAFQHILYLSAFNTENDADITPVFSTVITQWGIFSATLDDIDALADGARIGIPDDPSNGGRALNILESAGLIELTDDAGDFPTVDDIETNERNLQFVPLPARDIPLQFEDPSLSAVIVGTSYFDPSQGIGADDALFLDDSLDEKNLPYVNVVATRADDVDNPAWKILEEAYADPRVADALEEEYFGNTVLVDVDVEDLRAKLADLEAAAAQG
ncbi:D-methionine transport system substrate-binding protein [Microbacterium sp. SLBN-154]|uniref:MetQ/NlpA family ABC transporter substrate-binding protein n=1 Tax=Microbacterium sp. SLBN-154 TaxID=2768458 RepID=UPI001154D15C|nr:MetQ/NlpA family ABC transporter substrate-binding protein [Microbacterium sp. SLBN-154]TQK20679.1 D-methionine transport system substrate-binding protein [Microbacterium sp. SLBN-154]